MSGDVGVRKRLIAITLGNLRNNHIHLSGHHDFFPPEAYGQSSGKTSKATAVTLHVDGLREPIITDIAANPSNGRPRNFFRKRAWVGKFFEKHEIREGDVVAIERLDKSHLPCLPVRTKNACEGSAIPDHWFTSDSKTPIAFAGAEMAVRIHG